MIGQNYKYKDFSMSDLLGPSQRIILTNVERKVSTDTNIYNRANYHGTYSSKTLARGRIFSFSGKIIEYDPCMREQKRDLVNTVIQVVPNPNLNEFFRLEWEDKCGNGRRVMAKVYTLPEATNGLCDPIIDFNFDLYAENPWIFGTVEQFVTGSLGVYGGNNLWNYLPNQLNAVSNGISVINNGNFDAPCKIEVIGPTNGLQIINVTNGTKLKINGTTTSLLVDNRNINNIPSENFIMTDNTADIRYKRERGGPITLSPGQNVLSFSDITLDPTTVVKITWYDTYMS